MKTSQYASIKVSVCGIYADGTFKSEMVNQGLMSEVVKVLDRKENWYKISLLHDSYEGWIHEMYLKFNNTEDSKALSNNRDYKDFFFKSSNS